MAGGGFVPLAPSGASVRSMASASGPSRKTTMSSAPALVRTRRVQASGTPSRTDPRVAQAVSERCTALLSTCRSPRTPLSPLHRATAAATNSSEMSTRAAVVPSSAYTLGTRCVRAIAAFSSSL